MVQCFAHGRIAAGSAVEIFGGGNLTGEVLVRTCTTPGSDEVFGFAERDADHHDQLTVITEGFARAKVGTLNGSTDLLPGVALRVESDGALGPASAGGWSCALMLGRVDTAEDLGLQPVYVLPRIRTNFWSAGLTDLTTRKEEV